VSVISCSFRTGRQEDAHEYLIALLDAMHTMALGGPGVKVKPEEAAAKSLIYRIFAGKMRSTVCNPSLLETAGTWLQYPRSLHCPC
jgi:ubiquitin carboxyl-terminal hydrolase 36/42